MTRVLAASPIGVASFIAALAIASLAVEAGLVPSDTLSLWAGSIIAGDGQQSIGRIVAAYPTIPFMATSALEFFAPAGTPVPALLAAALVGLIAALWFVAFRKSGLNVFVAGIATALLAFHPALLRAAIAGPSEMLVVLFMFMFGNALFDLRERCAAPEVMAVSLALLGLAFSHPMGAAFACAAVPFLVFAVRPVLVRNSAFNVVLVLVFPTVFAVGAFSYVSWVFPGDGWSFYSAPSQSLTAWTIGVSQIFGGGLTGNLIIDASLGFATALLMGAPLAAVAAYRVRQRRPLLAPPAVLAATTIGAVAISVGTGLFGDPAAVAVAAPVLCAVVIIRIPPARENAGIMLGLLLLGWFGGALALTLIDPRAASRFTGFEIALGHERVDALDLGHALAKRNGVIVDTDNAPAVVVGRSYARGLVTPSDEQFTFAILLSRIDTPYVAVPDPHSATGAQDRIVRAFPLLYQNGTGGYRLVYQNATWRLYARN